MWFAGLGAALIGPYLALDGKLPAKQDCGGERQEKNKSLLHLKISKPASQYDRHRPPWIRNSLKVWPEDARRQLSRVKRISGQDHTLHPKTDGSAGAVAGPVDDLALPEIELDASANVDEGDLE
jgi:hypothetical protein